MDAALALPRRFGPERFAPPSPQAMAMLAEAVSNSGGALASMDRSRLSAAWNATVEAFLDPCSFERLALDPHLIPATGLSPRGLEAALQIVLRGVADTSAQRLIDQGADRRPEHGFVLIVLASNLPALVVQPLLAALAVGRPAIIKSPTAEPYFAAAFVRALTERLPELESAIAALSWQGGQASLEAPLLERAGRVIAYGEAETLDSLAERTEAPLIGYGPKTSLAIACSDDLASPQATEQLAQGLAHDVALFDQRGCLSVGTVLFEGSEAEARTLGIALAKELKEAATLWPPGAAQPAQASAVRLLREECELVGGWLVDLPIEIGTVLVDPLLGRPEFRPSPGLRTVRIQPIESLAGVIDILRPWRDRIQGVSWTKSVETRAPGPISLRTALQSFGVSRFAEPGQLQAVDSDWHNGGLHPLTALGGPVGQKES